MEELMKECLMLEGFSTITSQGGRFSPACILSFTHALIFLKTIY